MLHVLADSGFRLDLQYKQQKSPTVSSGAFYLFVNQKKK
jgi:hypothetical protein